MLYSQPTKPNGDWHERWYTMEWKFSHRRPFTPPPAALQQQHQATYSIHSKSIYERTQERVNLNLNSHNTVAHEYDYTRPILATAPSTGRPNSFYYKYVPWTASTGTNIRSRSRSLLPSPFAKDEEEQPVKPTTQRINSFKLTSYICILYSTYSYCGSVLMSPPSPSPIYTPTISSGIPCTHPHTTSPSRASWITNSTSPLILGWNARGRSTTVFVTFPFRA